MEKIYLVTSGKVADSGFVCYLVLAKNQHEALKIGKKKTYYTPVVEEMTLSENNRIIEIVNYDNPYYEG